MALSLGLQSIFVVSQARIPPILPNRDFLHSCVQEVHFSSGCHSSRLAFTWCVVLTKNCYLDYNMYMHIMTREVQGHFWGDHERCVSRFKSAHVQNEKTLTTS